MMKTSYKDIESMPVERDINGMWTHPAFDCDEEFVPREWFSDRGLDVSCVEFEYDANEDLVDSWFEDGSADALRGNQASQKEKAGLFFQFTIRKMGLSVFGSET